MNFSDCLKAASASNPSSPLRKSLTKAGIGLVCLAMLPLLSAGSSAFGPALKMALVLGAVCGLAYVALRFLATKKGTATTEASSLNVVARTSLSPKNGVAIVEADGKRFLVAYGDGFTTLLSNMPSETP